MSNKLQYLLSPFVILSVVSLMATCSAADDEEQIQNLISQLQSGNTESKRDAARELAKLGVDAKPAVDALAESIHHGDRQVCTNSLDALAKIGPEAHSAIPNLLKRIDNGDDQQRYRAAYALGQIGQKSVAQILDALKQTANEDEITALLQAIGWIGVEADSAIPELVRHLSHDSAEARKAAVESLSKIGALAIEPLHVALASEDEKQRAYAAQVFVLLESGNPKTIGLLEKLLRDESSIVRREAALAFGRRTPDNGDAVEKIGLLIEDEEFTVREAAVSAILRKRRNRATALSQVTKLLKAQPQDVELATYFIGRLGEAGGPAVQNLLDSLESNPDLAQPISNTLAKIGLEATESVLQAVADGKIPIESARHIFQPLGERGLQRIAQLLDSDNDSIKPAAIESIGFVRPVLSSSSGRLIVFLQNENVEFRLAAATGLYHLGEAAKPAESALRQAVRDSDSRVKAAAIAALFNSGIEAQSLAAELASGLSSDSVVVRRQSAQTFVKFEKLSSDQTKLLVKSLNDTDTEVQTLALQALANSEELSPQGIEAVIALLDSPILDTVVAALKTLSRFNAAAIHKDSFSKLLDSSNSQVVITTLETLQEFGSDASEMNNKINTLLGHQSSEIRAVALATISETMTEKDELNKILIDKLTDNDWAVRKRSAELLATQGAAAKSAVPVLLERLGEREDRDFAGNALREIDAAPPEAVPQIIEILKNSQSRRSRYYAIHLLRKVEQTAAQEALPTLREVANRDSLDSRAKKFINDVIDQIEGEEEE